jgi:hypothetical protein
MKNLCALAALTLLFGAGASAQNSGDFLAQQKIASLAILPPLGQSVPSATREVAADLFNTKLKLRSSALKTTTPDSALERIHREGLMNDYGNFITLLAQTGTTNRDALTKIGLAVGVDGLLLINVLEYDEEKGSWWYGKGGKNLARIQYSLFRVSDGQQIWQSLEFRQHDSKLSTNPYPMERVISDVSEKAVDSLLSGKQNADLRRKEP